MIQHNEYSYFFTGECLNWIFLTFLFTTAQFLLLKYSMFMKAHGKTNALLMASEFIKNPVSYTRTAMAEPCLIEEFVLAEVKALQDSDKMKSPENVNKYLKSWENSIKDNFNKTKANTSLSESHKAKHLELFGSVALTNAETFFGYDFGFYRDSLTKMAFAGQNPELVNKYLIKKN